MTTTCVRVPVFIERVHTSVPAALDQSSTDETPKANYTPAIGFAGGIERIIELINYSPKEERPIYLILIGTEAGEHTLTLANELRRNGLYVVYEHSGTLKTRMKKANQANRKVVLIFGDEELSSQTSKIKNMDTGEEKMIAGDKIVENI